MATIYGRGSGTTAWGTSLADTIFVYGAAGGYGQGGDDRLYGDGAANKLVGGTGNDFADGGGGADYLDGGDGADSLFGGTGDDIVHGGAGNDHVAGGAGIDRVSGGAGNDRIDLYQGPADIPAAGTAREYINGGDGWDTLHVNASDARTDGAPVEHTFLHWGYGDRLLISFSAWTGDAPVAEVHNVEAVNVYAQGPALAYSGTDDRSFDGDAVRVSGTDRADYFSGGLHSETADLGAGDDWVRLSGGRDVLRLGSGADTLVLDGQSAADDDPNLFPVRTRVEDFDPEADAIDAANWFGGPLCVSEIGDDTLLTGQGVEVLLVNVNNYDPFIG